MTVTARRFLATILLAAAWAVFMCPPANATLQGLQVGMEAPDFSLRTITGDTATYGQLKGNTLTAVVFWSSWSKKSATLLARLQKLHEQYRGKGFSVIAINADDQVMSPQTVAEVRKITAQLKLDYPVVLDSGLGTFHEFGVIALPSTLLLDKERVIRYELTGYPLEGAEEMAEFITSTLDGKKRATPERTGYQPNASAIRLFNMAKSSMKSNRMPGAAEMWFKKAIESDPGFTLPYLGLADLYRRRGDNSLARGVYDQVLAKEPANVVGLCEEGLILVRGGKADQGRALLGKALASKGIYPPCYYYAGYAFGIHGDVGKAEQLFDEASRLTPADYAIQVYKGRMYEETGKGREAAAAYRKALEIILGFK